MDGYSRETAETVIGNAKTWKEEWNRLKKAQESLTAIKGVISNSQLSFENAEQNMNATTSSVKDAINITSFTGKYYPIMTDGLSIIKGTISKNETYIGNIDSALSKLDTDILTAHSNFQAAHSALSDFIDSYSCQLQEDGLYNEALSY